jgi:hypothetical protein
MTTTVPDTKPVKASRSSCGFWRAATASPQLCYDADGRGKGTCYGAVPALTLAVAMATLSRAGSLRLWRGRGLASGGRRAGCSRGCARRLQVCAWRCIGYVASIPRAR